MWNENNKRKLKFWNVRRVKFIDWTICICYFFLYHKQKFIAGMANVNSINWSLRIGNGIVRKQTSRKKCFLKKEVIYYIRENETENYKMKKALQEDIPKIEWKK